MSTRVHDPAPSPAPRSLPARIADRVPLDTALLLAPLAYCVHQIEESAGGFRAWRERHYGSTGPAPNPHLFAILTALGLLCILWFSVRRSKPTAALALLFYLTMQLHNALYHVGAGLAFADYSPGTVTAVLLYLPINLFLLWLGMREQWITRAGAGALLAVAGGLYWAFELIGPVVIGAGFVLATLVVLIADRRAGAVTSGRVPTVATGAASSARSPASPPAPSPPPFEH